MSDKNEKILYYLALVATAILTLLPFFHVGITNTDDFLYFNMAHADWDFWKLDATYYAQHQGRFFYLITKYFYYIPYLVDNYIYTKFVQYFTLCAAYLIFSYLIYKVFKSSKLGALTLLLLIFNTCVGYYYGYFPPIGYPFFFAFSFIVFVAGLLFFIAYTEKGGLWRSILSAALLFFASLFYENYLVFIALFILIVFIRNWKHFGFKKLWKESSFYAEIIPSVIVIVLYLLCYFGYRYYLSHILGVTTNYSGSTFSGNLDWDNFFKVVANFTFYNLPGRIFTFEETQYLLFENSLLAGGHSDSVFFVLTHAPAIAYVNALIQCGILWWLLKTDKFEKISWKAIISGLVISLIFAISSNVIVALTEKYNSEWVTHLQSYVTSFFSYFGIMSALALIIVATVKLFKSNVLHHIICIFWCLALFCFSVVNYYTNTHLSRAWEKSQNRIDMIREVDDYGFFNRIPIDAIIYMEQLMQPSGHHSSLVCDQSRNFERYIEICADNYDEFHFVQTKEELLDKAAFYPRASIYFVQVSESKKLGEILMAFSHISRLDTTDITLSVADSAEIYYLSPYKEYALFYNTNNGTDTMRTQAVMINSFNKQKKITHFTIKDSGLDPLGFTVSNMGIKTTDTINLP